MKFRVRLEAFGGFGVSGFTVSGVSEGMGVCG